MRVSAHITACIATVGIISTFFVSGQTVHGKKEEAVASNYENSLSQPSQIDQDDDEGPSRRPTKLSPNHSLQERPLQEKSLQERPLQEKPLQERPLQEKLVD